MKILLFDIETSPLMVYVWGLWENNVSLNQVVEDWSVLSWSAKWLGEKQLMYEDNRKSKNIRDDKKLLKRIWELLDEADIVITQNGKSFDSKKLNARFIQHKMEPPSSYKHIDTKVLAKKHFGFTSNSLEYMTDKLCKKYKKLKHKNFPGQELWNECLKGNPKAWKEMEKYNKHDVLALEELYTKLQPWDASVNFNLYSKSEAPVCSCGSKDFQKRGFFFTNVGKYQRYRCKRCGAETRDRKNILDKNVRVGTAR